MKRIKIQDIFTAKVAQDWAKFFLDGRILFVPPGVEDNIDMVQFTKDYPDTPWVQLNQVKEPFVFDFSDIVALIIPEE